MYVIVLTFAENIFILYPPWNKLFSEQFTDHYAFRNKYALKSSLTGLPSTCLTKKTKTWLTWSNKAHRKLPKIPRQLNWAKNSLTVTVPFRSSPFQVPWCQPSTVYHSQLHLWHFSFKIFHISEGETPWSSTEALSSLHLLTALSSPCPAEISLHTPPQGSPLPPPPRPGPECHSGPPQRPLSGSCSGGPLHT